jgi:hypothetical protein
LRRAHSNAITISKQFQNNVEPYYLSGEGTNKITNINPVDGTVIEPVTEGCNEATSRPTLFEN